MTGSEAMSSTSDAWRASPRSSRHSLPAVDPDAAANSQPVSVVSVSPGSSPNFTPSLLLANSSGIFTMRSAETGLSAPLVFGRQVKPDNQPEPDDPSLALARDPDGKPADGLARMNCSHPEDGWWFEDGTAGQQSYYLLLHGRMP